MRDRGSEETSDRICVIGAGPSGLATCRELTRAGIPFDCFEANRGIGGIWDVEVSNSGGYRSLETNTSKAKMAFSDFPFPEEAPDFLHHSQLLDYFEAYVDHFGFRDQIRLDCRVVGVRPAADSAWRIGLEDGSERSYRACVVATGQYAKPRWPEPRPPGRFGGDQIHAADYLDPKTPVDCRDKRVVVVGLGSSAAEIATELASSGDEPGPAAHVVLSARSGRYVLPKRIGGQPLDAMAPHPADGLPGILAWLPGPLRRRLFERLMKRGLGRIEATVGRPSTWGLPNPSFEPWAERPTLSEGFIPALEAGRIEPRAGIARFGDDGSRSDRTVHFEDGEARQADVLVWATGYEPDFPFLDDAVLGGPAAELALYRRIVHPTRENLFFVGFTRVSCSLWPVSEQQAHWLVGVLRGSIRLPPPARRLRRSIQVAKALPVFCNDYANGLQRDLR